MFKKAPLSETNTFNDLKEQLMGKRILVLGDDSGSLTEVLDKLGAEPVGIEIDALKVLIANAGIFNESGVPHLKTLQGDIGNLINTESDLFKKLSEGSPFDAIVSTAVFNAGSGIEKAIVNFATKERDDADFNTQGQNFGRALTDSLMKLLKENGYIMHTDVDMDDMFGKYGARKISENDDYAGTGNDDHLIFIPKKYFTTLGEYCK